VVPYRWDMQDGDASRLPRPLVPGDSDMLVVTKAHGGFKKTTSCKVTMLVGTSPSAVELLVKYDDTKDHTWRISTAIDENDLHDFDQEPQLVGASFAATDPSVFPSFSFYSTTTSAPTATITLTVYDLAGVPASA